MDKNNICIGHCENCTSNNLTFRECHRCGKCCLVAPCFYVESPKEKRVLGRIIHICDKLSFDGDVSFCSLKTRDSVGKCCSTPSIDSYFTEKEMIKFRKYINDVNLI